METESMDSQLRQEAWRVLFSLRQEKPLVQCFANFVSMDIMANTLLAVGASPAMVHSNLEAAEFAQLTSAVSINIGTLTPDWVEPMKKAATVAKSLGKPWVFDPVGCGATSFRTSASLELLEMQPTLVRGNASEISCLAGQSATVRGVDSTLQSSSQVLSAQEIARAHQCIVAVTGEIDYVTDGKTTVRVGNGVALLQKVTAAGCSLSSIASAFIVAGRKEGVPDVRSVAYACAVFGICAELAAQVSRGPGSFRVALIDQLHLINQEDIDKMAKIRLLEAHM